MFNTGLRCTVFNQKNQLQLLAWNYPVTSSLHTPQLTLPLPISKLLKRRRELVLDLSAYHFSITHDMLKWSSINMCRSGVGRFAGTQSVRTHTLTHKKSLDTSHTSCRDQQGEAVTLTPGSREVGDGGLAIQAVPEHHHHHTHSFKYSPHCSPIKLAGINKTQQVHRERPLSFMHSLNVILLACKEMLQGKVSNYAEKGSLVLTTHK